MDEHTQDATHGALERRSRELFRESVEGLDMRVRSRLTRARHAALDAAGNSGRRLGFLRVGVWTPAAGVSAAVLLAAALWFGAPLGNHTAPVADSQPSLEDLDIIAASDEGSGDALEMLQNDLDFYDFADKAATSGPAA
jgi:hypothetical protein